MTAPPPPPAPQRPLTPLLRPALALLAGLGITVLIVGGGVLITTLGALRGQDPNNFTPPSWYYAANMTLSFVGAAAGGFAVSRITRGRSLFTVMVLALILLVSGIAPILRGTPAAPGQPNWYPLALALLGPLGVLVGGIGERRGDSARSPRKAP
jgi:peptidoglycan/LPS O-acetylase OafA/YrhL